MSEKVVHQVQIIETDDGFRIELKGDKEELRHMIFGQREGRFGFGGRGHGPFGRHHHHHEHPFPTFEWQVEPPQPPQPPHEGHQPHQERRRGRRFGGRWEARWGYDMGPWWDEGESSAPTAESHEEPPAEV